MDEFVVQCRTTRYTLSREQILFDSPNFFSTCFLEDGYTEGESKTVTVRSHPLLFEYIIEYLSGYEILPLNPAALPRVMTLETAYKNLLKDAQYYQLDGLVRTLQTPQIGQGQMQALCDVGPVVQFDQLGTAGADIWDRLYLSDRGIALKDTNASLALFYAEDLHICMTRHWQQGWHPHTAKITLPENHLNNLVRKLETVLQSTKIDLSESIYFWRWLTIPSITINGRQISGEVMDMFFNQEACEANEPLTFLTRCWPIDQWWVLFQLDMEHPFYYPDSGEPAHFRTCAQIEAIYFTIERAHPLESSCHDLIYKISHIRIATATHVLPHALSYTSPAYASAHEEKNMDKPQLVRFEGPVEVDTSENVLRVNIAEADAEVTVSGTVDIDNEVSVTGDVTVSGDVSVSGDVGVSGDVSVIGEVEVVGDVGIIEGDDPLKVQMVQNEEESPAPPAKRLRRR